MDVAWVGIVASLVLGVPALYFQWRAHVRAERELRGHEIATVPPVQAPRPAPSWESPGERREPPEAGSFSWVAGFWGLILAGSLAVYLKTPYMVEGTGSVAAYSENLKGGLFLTSLFSVGLVLSAWIRGKDDVLFFGRIKRKIILFQSGAALAGLSVCAIVLITKSQYLS